MSLTTEFDLIQDNLVFPWIIRVITELLMFLSMPALSSNGVKLPWASQC